MAGPVKKYDFFAASLIFLFKKKGFLCLYWEVSVPRGGDIHIVRFALTCYVVEVVCQEFTLDLPVFTLRRGYSWD